MGGFGNVLFQILAYNILQNHNIKNVFFVEKLTEKNFITKSIKWTSHQKLYRDLIPESQTVKVSLVYTCIALLTGYLSKLSGRYFGFSTFYIDDKTLDNTKISSNIFGYFQEKNFLKTHQKELQLLGEKIKDKYGGPNSYDIVVHYRKGDSGWAVLHAGFYEQVKKLLKNESGNITLVTDSPDDAKVFFEEIPNITISNSTNAMDDFRIMLSAKKLYCAPSTFSWWAAHGLDTNSEIIAPKFLEDELGLYTRGIQKII